MAKTGKKHFKMLFNYLCLYNHLQLFAHWCLTCVSSFAFMEVAQMHVIVLVRNLLIK